MQGETLFEEEYIMIYITGDCHSDFRKFNKDNFPEQEHMTKEDYLIICGDFGGIWDIGWESKREKWWLDWLEEKSYTTLFVDGNHENFDRLNAYPMEQWHGGRVHKIRPSVLHLMRGQIFDISGKKIFSFGGASSHDISDGILDTEDPDFREKKKRFDKRNAMYRIKHLSWWEEEIASKEEMEEGRKNLREQEYTVDFIVTHCCSSSTQVEIGGEGLFQSDSQTDYLEFIKNYANYKKWFFGHYHDDRNVNEKEILLYEQIIRIA